MANTNILRPRLFIGHLLFFLISSCVQYFQFTDAATDTNTILQGQHITSSETIISAGNTFELGFFNLENSASAYVGIWYTKVPARTVVWVANRDYPLTSSSPVLKIGDDGNLAILDGRVNYKVTNVSSNGNASATLLDSGNLVLRDGNSGSLLWQSFDHPSDTLLPGMKLGSDKTTGNTWSLVSWTTSQDPHPGDFSIKVDPEGTDQFVIFKGSQRYWTSGTWNGQSFRRMPELRQFSHTYNFSYISNENESYFTYSVNDPSVISRLSMNASGRLEQLLWLGSTQHWNLFWSQPEAENACELYAYCGSFAVCNINTTPICRCLNGFQPRLSEDWGRFDFSGGCVRKVALQCEDNANSDKFLIMSNMTYPVNPRHLYLWSAAQCQSACLSNCSCSAYTYNSSSGGCSMWFGDLLNLQQLPEEDKDGGTIYLRLAPSEFGGSGDSGKKRLLLVMVPVIFFSFFLLGCCLSCQWRKRLKHKGKMEPSQNLLLYDPGVGTAATKNELSNGNLADPIKNGDSGLPLFSFASVSAATDKFSVENKLGEGGFGPVYKGKLLKGQEIAVKRLSKRSGQGLEELKNEAMLMAKLQHRNLVRLLGCCLERDEKILIYEYMSNKSLDSFLFDPTKRGQLDWTTRTSIIEGIAQGLLYLHQHSRLRIIHRDLKASNILLDKDMNPKISDFGMARIFGGNESQANTKRIIGTYGYMPPEYALEGLFSIKSDVFSFGVLLLEILSGKRNMGFYQSDSLNLIGYAWELWKIDRAMDLMDALLEDQSSKHTMLRCINIALLCVQEIAADRPTMSEVVSMLINELAPLPSPKQPAFSFVRTATNPNSTASGPEIYSINGQLSQYWNLDSSSGFRS